MPTAAGLYYFAHGVENKYRPPVILIHGAGGNHLHWPAQIRRMPDQRIFAVDLPGHGKSEGIGHHTVEDYANDIVEFIQALKLNAAILVGHSMGSAIALKVAIHHPKQVLALGLVGSGSRLRVMPALLHNASNESTFADAVRMVNEYSYTSSHARLKELGEKRMLESRSAILYGDLLACDAFNETDQIQNISTPTLLVCGAEDKMTPPKYSEILCNSIPAAKMEIIPDAGHMAMIEKPDQTAEILMGFFNTIPYQPGQY